MTSKAVDDPSTSAQATADKNGSSLQHANSEPFLQPWQFFLLGGMLAATATVIVATGQSPANIVILSITVVSVSFVGLGAYRMLSPLVSEQADAPVMIAGRTRIALEREKMLVLRSIKELEFDFAMGKVAKADFDEVSSRLRARALGLMRQLDAGGGYREQIAEEVKRRLEAEGTVRLTPDAAEALQVGEAPAAGMCSSCETQNDADAKFCKNCGARL